MSNNIETTPAAELVGQHSILEWEISELDDGDNDCRDLKNDVKLIAQELDRRVQAAGISIDGFGCIVFRDVFKSSKGIHIPLDSGTKGIPASELHALLGWLLMKGGK